MSGLFGTLDNNTSRIKNDIRTVLYPNDIAKLCELSMEATWPGQASNRWFDHIANPKSTRHHPVCDLKSQQLGEELITFFKYSIAAKNLAGVFLSPWTAKLAKVLVKIDAYQELNIRELALVSKLYDIYMQEKELDEIITDNNCVDATVPTAFTNEFNGITTDATFIKEVDPKIRSEKKSRILMFKTDTNSLLKTQIGLVDRTTSSLVDWFIAKANMAETISLELPSISTRQTLEGGHKYLVASHLNFII